ncbi:hybrid sensor histidine kinase/response regulator [Pseudomonas gingeri]|uniref:hybrid sensor histidine kinase/response regulator n=1 Tax=Pseudomonas gingeri TaxID=117681 RepID=UPI0015A07394|nr:hybrid sensor histidine kinase/response regulator [Pseudomonas gingeri]NWA04348.1 response regulator [Pseudomonas gingeri]NWA15675.1 response regulator [Pseudomonas gingeri]NWA58153.1 response regulator [Pseudomonas gingeri]NWA96171.1 response regulator [Pseudomonas gingeri]NWB04970.1 response regulator [Pseudomonas gingeri]
MRYLLMMLLSCLPLMASAVEFDESTLSLPLGRIMQVFEDVSGQADIADISAPAKAGQFRRHDKDALNAGYSRSAFWLKVDLSYKPKHPDARRTWLLEMAYPPMDHIDLYLPDAAGEYRLAQRTGDELPFASRPIKQNNYLFELDFAPGESKTVYLRLQTEGSVQAPLSLWSSQAYLEEQPVRLYVLGLIYGVLLGMLVYNLFIYLSVRDTSYLYYIFYIASFGFYQLSVNGAAVQYFWPNNPWWANAATPFLIGSAGFFGCQFARSFLHTAAHSRWLDRLLLLLMGFGALVMALSLMTSYALALRLATALALAFTVTIFYAGISAWYCGQRVARYFIIAWSAFLLGGLVNTLMVLGYLPNMFLTMYASQIGSALEVGLLSLALADRINAMREQQAQTLLESGQKLEVLNQELANSNRLKDEFLATVTHELRTPMNGVIGSLELMQTVELDPELEQYQQTAAGSARDMMRMVNGILTLTELQAGRLKVYPQTFSLRGLLDGLQEQFAGNVLNKGLHFAVEVADELPDSLHGDATKIAQCLDCLVDNAIKFTREGGLVLRVIGHAPQPGQLTLSFAVIDSGIGFTDLDEATLYQRFFQLDGSMTREYGGLGIGLAICRQLIELLGGRLTHQSESGMGSRFQIEVDVEVLSPRVNRAAASTPRSPRDCTVLLVDGNDISQLVVRGMLLKLGYRVLTANNPRAAIDILRVEAVDALLLDCSADQSGETILCGQLRSLPGCAELPILALTSLLNGVERERCLAAGITDYLHKPVRFEELQSLLVRRLLNQTEGESADI